MLHVSRRKLPEARTEGFTITGSGVVSGWGSAVGAGPAVGAGSSVGAGWKVSEGSGVLRGAEVSGAGVAVVTVSPRLGSAVGPAVGAGEGSGFFQQPNRVSASVSARARASSLFKCVRSFLLQYSISASRGKSRSSGSSSSFFISRMVLEK